jgi:predicted DNA-binding transcriptional regulator AlpA
MKQPLAERLVTFSAVANRLAVTDAELCLLVVRKVLPQPIRLAGRLKFFKSDIDGFLASIHYRRTGKFNLNR